MRNVWIIAKREYKERVRTKSFLIMTIFIPALMFGLVVIPSLIASRGASAKHVMVVADQQTAELIMKQMQQPDDDNSDVNNSKKGVKAPSRYQVDVETDTSAEKRAALTEKVSKKQLDGVIWATDDAIAANKVPYITRDVSSLNEVFGIQQKVSRALHRRVLKSHGMNDKDVESALKPVDLDPQDPSGKASGNPLAAFFTVFSLVMVMYMAVLLYGINVMRAILEEKTSRIMEVMLSTASPNEMMAGKILGVGAVGLTQIGIWLVTSSIIGGMGAAAMAGALKGLVSVKMLVAFPAFFLLGYVLYSTLCAAVGAMVNSEQEAQQMQFFVMMPMIVSVIIMVNIIQYPGTPLAFWASMFPFTSPLIMFARIATEEVPPHQIAISIALLLATIYAMVWLCGRIYRVGILMYGKKPTLPEILKWIKYA